MARDNETEPAPSDAGITYRKPIGIRFDLIPPLALRRLAKVYEEGARVYGPSTYVFSNFTATNVINHLLNHLTLWESGDRTEDHLPKIAWAAFTLMVLEQERPEAVDVCSYGLRVDPSHFRDRDVESDRKKGDPLRKLPAL